MSNYVSNCLRSLLMEEPQIVEQQKYTKLETGRLTAEAVYRNYQAVYGVNRHESSATFDQANEPEKPKYHHTYDAPIAPGLLIPPIHYLNDTSHPDRYLSQFDKMWAEKHGIKVSPRKRSATPPPPAPIEEKKKKPKRTIRFTNALYEPLTITVLDTE